MKKISLYIFFLLTFVTVLYSLPTLNINLLGKDYSFFNWDINSLLKNNSVLGNLRIGSGFNANKIYFLEYTELEKEEFENILKTMDARSKVAKLTDIKVEGFYSEENSKVAIRIPEHLNEHELIVNWLNKRGDIQFYIIDVNGNELLADWGIQDISGYINVKYEKNYGHHLEFKLNSQSFANVQAQLFQGNINSIILKIDDTPEYSLIPVTRQTSNGVEVLNKFKLLSLSSADGSQQVLLGNLTKALFVTQNLSVSGNIPSSVLTQDPVYKNAKLSHFFIIAFFILGISILQNLKINYQEKKRFLYLLVSFVFVLSINITLMKFMAGTVSLLGYITYVFFAIFLSDVIFNKFENIQKNLFSLALVNLFFIYLNYIYISKFEYSIDAINMLLTLIISLLLFLYIFANMVKSKI
jgi:hypothetical protein